MLPESSFETPTPAIEIKTPTPRQQSWGAIISIIIIVLMIIVGAFYSWGKRISQNNMPTASTTSQ